MKFGQRVRELQKQQAKLKGSKRITLVELSKLAGVSVPYLSDIETGKVNPSIKTVLKIAEGLNSPPFKLLIYVDDV